jgi:hypothetical protein
MHHRLRPLLLVAGTLLSAPAMAAIGITGSGTVEFRFTSFEGPAQLSFPPGLFGPSDPGSRITGTVNGQLPTLGPSVSVNPPSPITWEIGTLDLSGSPVSSVTLVDDPIFSTPERENIFSWTPAAFSNVAPGTDFTLGTLTFQNGSWFGGGATAALNRPTTLGFTVTTISSDGPQFNQTRNLKLVHTVNAPFPNDTTTLPGQQAAADWVTIFDADSGAELNSFRVYDLNQAPPGFTNVGTVDLIGRFGSLDIVGFANPVGGFITADSEPLPPVPPGGGGGGGGPIPEPAIWALLIAGFGMVGGAVRRRRSAEPAAA